MLSPQQQQTKTSQSDFFACCTHNFFFWTTWWVTITLTWGRSHTYTDDVIRMCQYDASFLSHSKWAGPEEGDQQRSNTPGLNSSQSFRTHQSKQKETLHRILFMPFVLITSFSKQWGHQQNPNKSNCWFGKVKRVKLWWLEFQKFTLRCCTFLELDKQEVLAKQNICLQDGTKDQKRF